MIARPGALNSVTITNETGLGSRASQGIGYTFAYDNRLTGLDPNIGYRLEFSQDFAGLGGDNDYVRTTVKALAQRRVLSEEVTLIASLLLGLIAAFGDSVSTIVMSLGEGLISMAYTSVIVAVMASIYYQLSGDVTSAADVFE